MTYQFITRAELGEARASHHKNDNPGHIFGPPSPPFPQNCRHCLWTAPNEEKIGPLTNNDLPVLPIIGDLITRAELRERATSHDKDNNPGNVFGLGGPGGGVLAVPASISTTAIRNKMNEQPSAVSCRLVLSLWVPFYVRNCIE